MYRKRPLFPDLRYVFIPLLVIILSACFSPWQGDEGTLTLQLGPGNSGRLAVEENERNSLSYTVTLTGPGPSVNQTFSGMDTATFKLRPGTWNVTVKGRGARPVEFGYYENVFPDVMLRAYGEKTVTVRGGGSVSEAITMFPAVEAENGEQLNIAFNNASFDGVNNTGKKEYVFITENIIITDDGSGNGVGYPLSVKQGQNIVLRAEKKVTIERYSRSDEDIHLITINEGGKLTLGKEGETNQYLQISGEIGGKDQNGVATSGYAPYAEVPLIGVGFIDPSDGTTYNGGTLVMHDAQIYHNRVESGTDGPQSGVYVTGPNAKFEMYGGLIFGNGGEVMDGGGVAVDGGGTFTLYGGNIEGNEARFGGQVYVGDGGSFIMGGGILSKKGSTAEYQSDSGAGVYVDIGGTFKKEGGGIIYGSSPPDGVNNLNAQYLGDAVFYSGTNSYERNATLGTDDNISTENLSSPPWDQI